jgi:hypothetical protein
MNPDFTTKTRRREENPLTGENRANRVFPSPLSPLPHVELSGVVGCFTILALKKPHVSRLNSALIRFIPRYSGLLEAMHPERPAYSGINRAIPP